VKKKNKAAAAGTIRIIIVIIIILLQTALIFFLVNTLRNTAVWAYAVIDILLVATMIVLVSRNRNSSYTIAWIFIIALFPLFGYVLYTIWGHSDIRGIRNKRIRKSIAHGSTFLSDSENEAFQTLAAQYPMHKRISTYLRRKNFPVYQNTSCRYYSLGETQFDAMLADFAAAKKFIFIQTFILSEGKLWDEMSKILIKKAAEGVEVRLMYDDLGSASTFSRSAAQYLKKHGVNVTGYSPIHQYILSLSINYRNHQKITIIDGSTAYTGGTNIADEYANYYIKHGHWKDTAIRLQGEAVWSLTVTFLQLWDSEAKVYSSYNNYRPDCSEKINGGFFQPFSDGPVNNPENPAETMYNKMIAGSLEYLYITTPYLIPDNSMLDLLCTAAASGVDVCIITPKIWDKWYVHAVSRSNYGELLAAGVRIFEYSPGYMHAKMIISDDSHCIIGSINMDYRSFHHHFENGVWICGDPVVMEMKKDILETIAKSEEITLQQWERTPLIVKTIEGILRVFSVMF